MSNMIGGIILFILLVLNVLLGHRIIKADRKVHIIIGWIILVLGIMHGVSGISMTMGWGQ